MTYPLSVRRSNDLFARELGYQDNHQRYSWRWSEELTMPMVIVDDAGKVQYDYFCACGKNQRVHSALCSWTQPRPQWDMRSLVPNLHRQWVVCRWVPPQASKEDWQDCFGALAFPASGFHVPVGDQDKPLAILEGQTPFIQTTKEVIRHIREHFAKSARDRTEEDKSKQSRTEKSFADKLYEQSKELCEKALAGDHWNNSWVPQAGVGPSPMERKIVLPHEVNANHSASVVL